MSELDNLRAARGVAASDQFPGGSLQSEDQYTKWRFGAGGFLSRVVLVFDNCSSL
jgi:hypothetical protein